ncbi:TonB-dependent receptor [Sphingomonas sp.]|uniref:TonB-dependent receptor n=1 Tax=Sphingomonas sp. TaxID=28214 RepID=UPI002FD8BDC4
MSRHLSTLVRSLALAGVAVCALTPAFATPAPEATISLAIGSRDLGSALTEFARQSGRQILFAPDLVRGKRAPELRGRYGVDRALAMLLAGSGLRYRTTAGGTFVVEGHGTEGAGTAPAPRVRQAQATAAGPQEDPAAEDLEIVVTGTAGAGTRRQDASFAVTTINDAAIGRLAPASTAEVLRVVPGISVESSGGKNGANIFVRGYPSGGDAEYVTIQSEGVPIFSPPTLSFLENSQLIRIDSTLKRVEAVRGGTGALFSSGQPGLTINFVQREGGATPDNLLKLGVASYGDVRADGYLSGPLGAGTTYMVGGYYSAGNGVRNPRFTAEKGGQITANVRHDFDNGSVLVFGRYLNDRGQWLLPIPVVQNGKKISQYGNFDAGSGTLAGGETRLGVLNDGTRVDLADGRGADVVNLGGNFEYRLGDGFKLRDRLSWLKGDANTTGLVPGGAPPQSAAAFAAGRAGTIGSLTFVNGGQAVPGTTQVVEAGLWRVQKRIENFSNDLALEWKKGSNSFTAGVYYAAYSSRDHWNLGNSQLLTAEPNARRLNLTLADGRIVTRNGFTSGSTFNVNADYDGKDAAVYAVDELQVNEQLRLDAGLRYQDHSVDGTLENNGSAPAGGLDGNPNTLYDNGDAVLNGTFSTIRYRGEKWSWTAGANYDFTRSIGLFLRYSRGNSFPFFDNLRDGITVAPRVDTYEGGLKVSTDLASAYLTVFHNDFNGLATTVITSGAPIASIGGARATGVELEGELRPVRNFTIGFSGTYLDSKYRDFFTDNGRTNLTGNQVQRQPKWQWRVSPAYSVDFGSESKATLFTSVTYIGDRFSDVQNAQLLPNYYKWDAGLTVDVTKRITLQATVDNITNTIGLTEGNPRTIGSQGSGVILARPILGRSALFSASYRF